MCVCVRARAYVNQLKPARHSVSYSMVVCRSTDLLVSTFTTDCDKVLGVTKVSLTYSLDVSEDSSR